MSFDEQKVEAVYKIREALVANNPFEAVGLLRAARELWPEGDSFGTSDIDTDGELNVLREIHFSGLQRNLSEKNVEAVESDYEEEDEEMESQSSIAEQKLDIEDVYNRYANHKVVYPCSLLLANYQKNKPQTNVCLIKLLHRIAWNCKMHGLFFQSTIFLTFKKIFHDPDVNCNPVIKELYRFAKFIVQKFFLCVQKNEKLFVELLFWKGPREVYELEEGYGASENKGKAWTEEEDEELLYLFNENKDIYIEGQDVADIILASLNTRKRTKLQIISALKRLSLIKSAKDLKPEKRKEWQENEVVELQHLFEDHKQSDDIMSIILDKLTIKRTRKAIIDKLLELNLIADKKEVRKKSLKKNTEKFGNANSDSSEDDGYSFNPHGSKNSDSSGDEDEIMFFKNLEAEQNVSDNDSLHDSQTTKKLSSIVDSNKKVTNNKLLTIWEEQEVIELTNLFNENSESDNIMHNILNSLSVKRSKKAVVEKLLELGLIKSKKEIMKKRKQEMHKILNSNVNEDSESDSDTPLNRKIVGKNLKRRILSDSDEDRNNSKRFDESPNFAQSMKKLPKDWDEEEVIQLNQLFIEYKDDDDVLFNIVPNLTIKRTRKNVIEKMLEIGLIKSKTDLKRKKMLNKANSSKQNINKIAKSKSKKSSELWEESEIVELNQLYQNHKSSNNIITDILNGLSLKRNKKDVVEKMLEIGLIQDKKEIRKKRVSKKIKVTQNLSDDNINTKNVSSESSDNENEPLIPVIAKASLKKDLASNSKLKSSIVPPEDTLMTSDKITTNDNHVPPEHQSKLHHHPSFKESSVEEELSRPSKRKRLVINSDSDDSSTMKDLYNTDSVNQNISMLNSTEIRQENSLVLKKKKIRILEDSDESN